MGRRSGERCKCRIVTCDLRALVRLGADGQPPVGGSRKIIDS
jgi:hypothetical protein